VITVSDGVSSGTREDRSGDALADFLSEHGYAVSRTVVPDDQSAIVSALHDARREARLVITTGGTGFGPRDVTPEATNLVLEKEAPGLIHVMTAAGLESTPLAALSRGRAGSVGTSLVVNVPGSTKGAIESVEAVIDLIGHALDLLQGDTEHS
jgi:molybdopterin adenylyltransferase